MRDDPRFMAMLDKAKKRLGIDQPKDARASELSR
jgi:hypothetical protein